MRGGREFGEKRGFTLCGVGWGLASSPGAGCAGEEQVDQGQDQIELGGVGAASAHIGERQGTGTVHAGQGGHEGGNFSVDVEAVEVGQAERLTHRSRAQFGEGLHLFGGDGTASEGEGIGQVLRREG